jgi:quercetin dioxygenase-like cupin family protein
VTADLDRAVRADDLPWVEQSEGVWFKPLRLSPEREMWANLLRVSAGGLVSRHRHHGPVEAWVIHGRWRYLEHDWLAGPGSYVHEPKGDVHTLVVEGGEEMVTLFIVHGAIDYLDDRDRVVRTDTAQRKLELYEAHCRAHGLPLLDVVY